MTDNRSGTTAPHVTRLTLVLLTSTMLSGVPQAMAQTVLPSGGSVAAGSATIGTPSNGALTVTQSSASAVVNWQSFSVGQGNAVNFVQPSSTSAILNRVTGSATSNIAGQINANGQVYLVNPNGIAITSTGTVNAAGFVASTLGISDSDFMSGKRTFTGNGASASVTNNGTITIGRGGYAALLGGSVDNAGTITVPLGKVGLGSGEQATLDLSGDGFMQVAVPTNAAGSQALVSNSGKISANGGSVQLSAAAARNMARQAINMSGTIEAKSVGGRNGAIILGGSDGAVAVSGKLNVASRKAKGGSITVTGRDIKLAGATLDASGKTGGGTINIGGDRQGQGPLQRAQTVSIDSKTAIKADAKQTGNGGNVVVWSDNLTTFAGHISARGGALSGHGGEAEVSGKAKLDYTGLTDLSAANGRFGNLLLDPYNVIISNGVNNTGGSFDANTNDSVINATTLSTQLGLASVAVTTGSGGSQLGNITVAAPVSWSAPTTLTLNAANAISVNAPITVNGAGGVSLTYNTASPANLTFAPGASLNYGTTDNGGTLSINGQAYTLLYSLRDIENINNRLSGNYALATSLDAAGTTYTTGVVAGGGSSGNRPATAFSGTFEGLGQTIANLTINGGSYVGLFGYSTGTIRDIGLTGGSVNGISYVGGLVGYQDSGGTISNAYATGAVSGYSIVGGLVGFQSGAISNAYATSAVSGSAIYVGGLVGLQNGGTINDAYATGSVSGTFYVGGLVGLQTGGTISSAYATGAVSGTNYVGGLVGVQNGGTISNAYATGAVNGTSYIGGLVGYQYFGTISNAYATGAVSGTSLVGGLVGYQDSGGTISNAYATGAVSGTNLVGGLVGSQSGTISNSYWDIQTSGQSSSAGGTGLTTAAFQSGGASRLGSAFSGGANGLYPYLTSFYPNGVQALSGFAYTDSGVTKAASGLNGPQYVYIDIAGKQTAVTTGANGYYYLAVANGTLSSANGGTATLAYTLAGNVTGPVAGAHLMAATGTTANVDIWGNTLIAPTTATMLSAAPTDGAALLAANGSANQTLLAAALGNDTAASGVSNLSLAGYVATGAGGFTIDQGITANGLYARTTNGPITVSSAQTLGGPINLELISAGALAINAPITVNGAGSVTLAYDASSPTNLTFATGASLNYGATDNGGTLSINGQAYTLLYSMRDIENINNRLSGNYALATSLNAASTTYTTGVVAGGNSSGLAPATAFSGIFEGLGQTIANLTINGGSNYYVGLFGYSTGTIRDIGLTGGSVSGTSLVGGLVGFQYGGTISNAYATGAVSGTFYVGGLVGYQDGGSTIGNAYATSAVSGGTFVGGLVGYQDGGSTIGNAYATGSVSGTSYVGGLVGFQNGGTISNAYATGAVSGTSYVGGLVGYQSGGSTISNAYATGAVNGTGFVGGLVGDKGGTISNSYWDIQTSGQSSSAGGTGLTTAQMRDPFTFINAGWDLANVWGKSTTGANGGNMMLRGLSTGLYDDYVQVMGNTSKIYGDANPTLSGLSLSGLGTANVTLGWASGINAATGVGTYSYAGGGVLLVTDVPSRTLYVDATGTLSITPRAITVTADAQSRAYGNANPALTYAIAGGGLVNGDLLTGGLATAAGATSNVGSYAITQGSLAASSNYAVSYVGADLAVTKRALMLTADAKSRSYGDANPALTYAIGGGGLVNGDALNGALATAANSGSAAGSYAITRGTLSASANYSMTFVPGTLTVNAEINPPTSDLASTVVNSTPPGTIVTAAMLPATFSPTSGNGAGGTVVFADPRFDGIVICGGLNCVVAAP